MENIIATTLNHRRELDLLKNRNSHHVIDIALNHLCLELLQLRMEVQDLGKELVAVGSYNHGDRKLIVLGKNVASCSFHELLQDTWWQRSMFMLVPKADMGG